MSGLVGSSWRRILSCHGSFLKCPKIELTCNCFCQYRKWAVTWQNQQNECAPSEDSDQPGHLSRLIRVFAVRMKKSWVFSYPLSVQWRLIKLVRCPGWSESSLGAHSFCWFCHVVTEIHYHIMGYFRVAKFSRFCFKNMAIIFSRILIFAVNNIREK